ncbi:MAG: hypothetical protein Harvfovirus3_1 [Harvfovirus sp.]|uniref:Uncharacterized protein n=1 Tax=Harvfovirus sp. TaxID=2487768 RepID=A0A3G4ZZZ4_9VIRU|nr:MAG: hypothetical protein Harvfovirus3_1 [Harvfovirus sp.]
MDIKDDIYLVIFVLHGIMNDNGQKITHMITSLTKSENLTEDEGIRIYLINLKTTQIEIISPTDSDQLKYLHPKDISSKKLMYSSGLTYEQLILQAARNFSFSSCLELEEKTKYEERETAYVIDKRDTEYVREEWKGKIKKDGVNWNCSIYQCKYGSDEISQRKIILMNDKNNLSEVDIDEILNRDIPKKKYLEQNENKNISRGSRDGIHFSFEDGKLKELKNEIGTIQIYNSGFRNDIRSIGIYDDEYIFSFSDHQLEESDFHIDLINIKNGKQNEYGIELLWSHAEKSEDYWDLKREINRALSYSNRTWIFTTTKYQKEETLDILQKVYNTGSIDVLKIIAEYAARQNAIDI